MINLIFYIILFLYFIHRLGWLPFCPFCAIHISTVKRILQQSIKYRGKILTYELVKQALNYSLTSKWITIYDELTKSNYEKEAQAEQISVQANEEGYIITEEILENPYTKEEETLP